ncbi:MAG TPA: sigma-54-dependent Fis family transcriptional regulator, partial [Betaproteobacteria bacterium]|nr:sigma-54-dependent Fis family transcriptional regulator [Betaproteobacteria bacterium]
MNMLPVLIVEDDRDLREALCDTLALAGYEVLEVADGASALQILQRRQVGLVVSDVQMQPMDGHALLQEIKCGYPYLPVLLMTAYGVIDKAVAAMRAGACDYLTKPFEPEKLLAEVARYMLPAFLDEGRGEVIVHDPRTREMLSLAQRVAATNATVMITGESGVGKEIVARYIHRCSPRAAHAFVALNCAAIPENLLESILFGHEKGAFTGA